MRRHPPCGGWSAYDAAGNPLDTTLSIPAGAPAFAGTSYKTTLYYNADSSLQAKQVPAMGGLPAETIRYSYDSWGELTGVRGSSIILANTVYSPIGQLAQFNRLNGSTSSAYSTYGYGAATGAVLSIKDNAVFGEVGHYVADRVFTRDAVGNVMSSTMNSVLPTTGTQKTCYFYDGLRQLKRAWTPKVGTYCASAPSAATMGGFEPYWHEYTYDTTTGNRTGLVKRSAAGAVSTAAYTYPAAGGDRPHAVSTVTGPAGVGPGSYTYDAAGNMTGRPGQTITFNDVGKVSKVVAGSVTQNTVYNVDGSILLRTNTSEGATLFVGDTVLSQANGSTVVAGVRTYSGAEGKPIAEKSAKSGTGGTTLTWLFSNLEGTVDVRTVATAAGTTTRTFRDPIGSSGVWSSGTGYMNKPVTASTGLTTVGARTYDPVLGKFLSVDPVIDTNLPQQNTGYTYSGNNPTTYMDPSGLRLSIGCEPRCGKGAATIAQNLTSRKTAMTGKPRISWIDGSSPDYPKPWQSASRWWEEQGPKDQYFRDGGYIDWIRSDTRFQAQRKTILESMVFGKPQEIRIKASPSEGWPKVGQMLQDGFTYASWLGRPISATDWDYQAQIGSYQGSMEMTRISENRIKIDYRLFNVLSFESASPIREIGAGLDTMQRELTQHFIWSEYVDG